jgi:hypothetical protein
MILVADFRNWPLPDQPGLSTGCPFMEVGRNWPAEGQNALLAA